MKQCDDQSEGTWFPVKQVPSEVHIDLLANKQYASLPTSIYASTDKLLESLIRSWMPTNLQCNGSRKRIGSTEPSSPHLMSRVPEWTWYF